MSILAALASGTANATHATVVAKASSTAAAVAVPTVNNSDLMFDINLFLLCAVGTTVLLLLPRATIRFIHKREWVDGHFFRYSPYLDPAPRNARRAREDVSYPPQAHMKTADEYFDYRDQWGSTTDASHTYASHADLLRKGSTASARERRRQNVPTHMPGVSTMFPSFAGFLRKTIHPGLTIGKAIILSGYSIIVFYGGLWLSNPFSDPVRLGFLATSQIPTVVLLGTKNNLLGMLIGFGYERLNYFHRFAGRVVVVASNVHAIGYFYKWSLAGTFTKEITNPDMRWGMVALVATDLLFLLSVDAVRSKFYNSIFIPSHIVSAVVLCIAACFHMPFCVPYVLVAVGIYGLDRLMRLVKTRITMARLRPLPDLGMTRVEVPGINAGWRAGQHIRLRVLSLGMGWHGWTEAHPFTIASVSRCPSGEGLVLMVKKAGDWTNKLYDMARRADYGEANGIGGTVQVAIEGPYGGPGHAIFSSFSGAMFVAGGSGITFALAAVRDLVKKDLEFRSRVRAIHLVWCIQDPTALTPLVPLFSSLIAESQDAYATLHISVFYTRAPPNADVLKTFQHLPPRFTLSPCRPKLGSILKKVVDDSSALFHAGQERARGKGPMTGVIVGTCGPSGLGDEARKAVAAFDKATRKRIGGLELHEEAFGW